MKKITTLILSLFGLFLFHHHVKAQCSVDAFPADTVTFTCGDSAVIELSAFGTSGNFAIDNNFNDGTPGQGWDGTLAATYTNPCVDSPDGSIYMWMGDATPQPRILTTQAFDLSTGGTICYEMRYSVQGDAAPCEGPDLPEEGVYLQYSIDNGATWVTISYIDPNGGYDPVLTTWQQYCYGIPAAAQTASTKIRWFQDATSGAEYDHWGLDNVFISVNDPAYGYEWEHNGFTGPEPPTVTTYGDSIFVVHYGNGVDDNCSDTVFVKTVPPVFTVLSVPDTSICGDGCINLNGTADVLVRPESQPSFLNNEFQPLLPLGQPTAIPLGTGNVEVATVTSGTIESVCLTVNDPAFPFPIDMSTFTIVLECPEGQSVTLVSQGDVSGTTLSNMCFSDAGVAISTGTPPYNGLFTPSVGSMDDFIDCSTNGVWTMTLTNSDFTAFGFFNSWSITFNVPEISYPGVFEWSPTTGLDDPSSLNPLACPEASTTYELMVSDSFNCASTTHEVTIGIIQPGQLSVVADVTDADCGSENGAISLTVNGASGNETVEWEDGTIGTQLVDVATGIYTVTVSDGCVLDTMITVGALGAPVLDSLTVQAPLPGSSNGQIEVLASGGTAPLQYSLNGGDLQSSNIFTDLDTGSYVVLVQDVYGCLDTVTISMSDFVEVFIPSVFNPNSANQGNQTFVILGMTEPEIQLFNRWGFKIYESSAYQNEWKGEKCSDGVYYYVIKDKADGQAYTGYVHLVR